MSTPGTPSPSLSPDDWKTTEMIRAENEFFEVAEAADLAVAEAQQRLVELEAAEQPPTNDEITSFVEFANRPDVPAEWRAVLDRVESGEVTWAAVVSGKAGDDPALNAAMDATARMGVVLTDDEAAAVGPAVDLDDAEDDADEEFDEDDFSANQTMRLD